MNIPESTPIKISDLLENIERYLESGESQNVLLGHQQSMLEDIVGFIRNKGTRGYIEAPTGTGKTVLFVTLAKAMSYGEHIPKILVVTPTKDLVRQTLGGTSGDKGFAGFAPEMEVGTFFSDTLAGDKRLESPVVITTYNSLKKLARSVVTTYDSERRATSKVVNNVEKLFDVILLDESHRALGERSREIISHLSPSKLIIGFTATPDFSEKRKLDSILPEMIHQLSLTEAIEMSMLSPVLPFSVPAPDKKAHHFNLNKSGEYDKQSLNSLIDDNARNELITNIAVKVIENGNTPIIASIPGDSMRHPNMLASMLSRKILHLSDGTTRPVRFVSVTGELPTNTRQHIFKQLEDGEIDGLAYIGILGEGWDSQIANVLINARPTRSILSAKQRLGRVLRLKANNRPAIAIDIVDKLTAETAPPVSMADIFGTLTVQSGQAFGEVSESFKKSFEKLLAELSEKFGFIAEVKNDYTSYTQLLEEVVKMNRGQAEFKQNGKVYSYLSAERLREKSGVDSLLLAYIAPQVEIRHARKGFETFDVYEDIGTKEVISHLPDGVRLGAYYVEGDRKYMAIDDMLSVLRKKYLRTSLKYGDIEHATTERGYSELQVLFTKHLRHVTHLNVPIYTVRTLIEDSFAQSIIDELAVAPAPVQKN